MTFRILDLFSGLGGASVGYHRAGFDVAGVDIEPQPDYPFAFLQADVMKLALDYADTFDAIHASPPCAAYTSIGKQNAALGHGHEHPKFYEPIHDALVRIGKPYVIENPAARADVVLCGEMFGLGVLRHRRFELGNWTMAQPQHLKHRGRVRSWRHGVKVDGPYVAVYGMGAKSSGRPISKGPGGGKANLAEARVAMGIDWSDDLHGITQAIPPAYTECVGRQLHAYLSTTAERRAA